MKIYPYHLLWLANVLVATAILLSITAWLLKISRLGRVSGVIYIVGVLLAFSSAIWERRRRGR